MSNRDSMGFGDLLPQDVVQVFSHEKHSKRGRKKRRRSLSRALRWLKGKRRKNPSANGKGPGLGPALKLDLDGNPVGHQAGPKGGHKSGRQSHPQRNSHAVPKRDDDDKTPAPPLFQENVFIESSRPKYLEDLHTQAMEGLKMMQQEETNNGVEYQDNESTISAVTVQTDGESGGFVTDSTIPDSSSVVSMQSSMSTRSSRSGLTRQGSTFRPLNSGKKSEKSRTRRRHRKTVTGIPKHVQKELGLDRTDWTLTQPLDEEQFCNGESADGPHERSTREGGGSLKAPNVILPLSKGRLKQLSAAHAGPRDDLALLHRLGPDLEGGQRPRSLAVPWMTTGSSLQQQPPSPVMSMSPQAAYLSKIIPNAVLPPSIDVVEISRGRSRSSVRTVSKSSLVLSSPAPSRASSRASSSRTTSSNITSASRYNAPNVSDSSCWSNSESSETLVSDSSTISSGSTPRQQRSQAEGGSIKQDTVLGSSSKYPTNGASNGKLIIKEDKVEKDGQFVRSLSVIKPKRAPPPPSRSYSLHNRMKRRSRDLAEARTVPGESSPHGTRATREGKEKGKLEPPPSTRVDSPGYQGDTSSLDDSTGSVTLALMKSQLQESKRQDAKINAETGSKEASQHKKEPARDNDHNKIVSPSSGYSSQDGNSPQGSKPPHSSSPKHKKGFFAKIHMLIHGSPSAGSAPSPPTQPKVQANIPEGPNPTLTHPVSPSVQTLKELFNIPPPPKVHAPPPPPPEVWAHNKRTFELLLGPPAPDNTYAIIKKNPKDRRQQRPPAPASTEGSVKSKNRNPAAPVEAPHASLEDPQAMKAQESRTLNGETHAESAERLADNGDVRGSAKDERMPGAKRSEEAGSASSFPPDASTRADPAPVLSLGHISSSPSPSLDHHPPPPLPTPLTSGQVVSPESCWPPPPPPIAPLGTPGADEVDLPLPPPPLLGEEVLVLPVQVPPKESPSCTSASVKPGLNEEGVTLITGAQPPKVRITPEEAAAIPPPPPYTAPPAPVAAAPPPKTERVPPPPEEVLPAPPLLRPEQSPAPVPPDVTPLVAAVSPSPLPDVQPPLVVEEESRSPEPREASPVPNVPPPLVVEEENRSPEPRKASPVPDVPPPLVVEEESRSPEPREASPVPDVTPPLVLEVSPLPSDEAATESKMKPPQSIPPSPPRLRPEQTTAPVPPDVTPLVAAVSPSPVPDVPPPLVVEEENRSPEPREASPVPDVPPPLVVEEENRSPEPREASPVPDVPPPLVVEKESRRPEPREAPEETAPPVGHGEAASTVTPSLLEVVKLRSVNKSPEPPEAREPPEPDVPTNQQPPGDQVSTSSSSSEAPQKPIRKSLILVSSPPVIEASQAVPPESSSTSVSPVKKTPPPTTVTPSMKLQEAIRLRTAARSRESPASHLSPPSPVSPPGSHKSPTTTASFVFSKSNKTVGTGNVKMMENQESKQKTNDISPETKLSSDAESARKGVKVPPAVAKKPKTKCKGAETSEGVIQTEGQEAEPESSNGATEETKIPAGNVEGGTSPT
ncbi:uncharacterized protein ACNS7B_000754 [Menidia menidia]